MPESHELINTIPLLPHLLHNPHIITTILPQQIVLIVNFNPIQYLLYSIQDVYIAVLQLVLFDDIDEGVAGFVVGGGCVGEDVSVAKDYVVGGCGGLGLWEA